MKIYHIIGGICTGKSTLLRHLKKEIPNSVSISIDIVRKKNPANPEKQMISKITKKMFFCDYLFIETSGSNRMINAFLKPLKPVTIKLCASQAEIRKRLIERFNDPYYAEKNYWNVKSLKEVVAFNNRISVIQSDFEINTEAKSETETVEEFLEKSLIKK